MTGSKSLGKQGKWFIGGDDVSLIVFPPFPSKISCSRERLKGEGKNHSVFVHMTLTFRFHYYSFFFTEVFSRDFFPHAVIDRFSQFSSDANEKYKILFLHEFNFPIQRKSFTWNFCLFARFSFHKTFNTDLMTKALDFHEVFRVFLSFTELSSF